MNITTENADEVTLRKGAVTLNVKSVEERAAVVAMFNSPYEPSVTALVLLLLNV